MLKLLYYSQNILRDVRLLCRQFDFAAVSMCGVSVWARFDMKECKIMAEFTVVFRSARARYFAPSSPILFSERDISSKVYIKERL